MKLTKATIFDFDGTIADSFEVFLEALHEITKRRQHLTNKEVKNLRKYSTKEVIKKLGIKPWQIPLLLTKGRREISARIDRVEAFKGIPEALKELSPSYAVYILSTNSEENINTFLTKYELNNHIRKIYANIGLMGKAKSLKKLQRKEKLVTSNCLYIGDETRDIEAARKVGMKCVAVQWGYSDPSALRAYKPDALAGAPQDLRRIVEEQLA